MFGQFTGFEDFNRKMTAEIDKMSKRIRQGIDVMSRPLDLGVGETPSEVVYEEDRIRLLDYKPLSETEHPTPVIVIYALVNRFYMLDLQQDRSMIRNLLQQGLNIFAIDWGYPTRADKFLTLDDYVNGYIDRCVDWVRARTGSDKVTILSICQGGTMSLMYSALHPEKVKNLVTVVTPFDFSTDDGLLNVWARDMDIDQVVDTLGNAPGDFMNVGFLMLNPFRLMFAKYVDFSENVDDPKFVSNFLRMEKWIFDSPDQAGETLRQFVKDLYQQNKLAKNEMVLGGRKVDLKNVTMPVLNVYGQFDHLVPPASSKPLLAAIPSTDKQEMCFPSGHIGIFVSSKSQTQLCPFIGKWIRERSGEPRKAGTGEAEALVRKTTRSRKK